MSDIYDDCYRKRKEFESVGGVDKEKGISMLEEMVKNSSYNNTVYNTLYQTYNKAKRFDDSIRICEKAIENLGLFSNDLKERWNINLEKAIERKKGR